MLEIYKNGGMYVDLTTFFVRPIPRDLDGFVAGGQMASVEGATVGGDMAIEGGLQREEDSRGDCSTPTASDKRHRPFIMQYSEAKHPVVECVLRMYDDEKSILNLCIVRPESKEYGALDCVLFALEYCTSHVVQPLEGSQAFKETGRYLSVRTVGKLPARLGAFPFLEEYENIVTGDGTVRYTLSIGTPEDIYADNPNAKVVFALRDPVARAWSDYRFLWSYFSSPDGRTFQEEVESTKSELEKCFKEIRIHENTGTEFTGGGPGQIKISTDDEKGMEKFYKRCSVKGDHHSIVPKGIYYYQVLYWMKVFGRDNVMVVDSADLGVRPKETLGEVYKFLGLCPYNLTDTEPDNVTSQPDIPDHKKIDAKMHKSLQDFYAPYNKKLYTLIGRDFEWENRQFKG